MLIALARTSSVSQFGLVALMTAVLTAALAITRAGVGTPMLLMAAAEDREIAREAGGGLAAALVAGLGVGVSVLAVGTGVGVWFLAVPLALAAPVLLQQDVMRHVSLAREGGRSAVAFDGVWLAFSMVALLLTATGSLPPEAVLWVWALGGLVSLVGLQLWLRARPRASLLAGWWQHRRSDRLRFAAEGAAGSTFSLVLVSAMAVILGAQGVAALRGAGTILGPLSLLFSAVPIAIIPRAVRLGAQEREVWFLLLRVAIVMSIGAAAIGAVFSVLPSSVGTALLGATWPGVSAIIAVTGVEYAGLAWLYCCWALFKTFSRTRLLLATRLTHLGLSGVCALLGALATREAVGAAVGLAAGSVVVATVLAVVTMQTTRRLATETS